MQSTAEHIDYKALYEQLKEEADITIASLRLQLEQLKKMIFGSKHERFVAATDAQSNPQLTLDLDLETIAACKITEASKVSYIRTKTEVTWKSKLVLITIIVFSLYFSSFTYAQDTLKKDQAAFSLDSKKLSSDSTTTTITTATFPKGNTEWLRYLVKNLVMPEEMRGSKFNRVVVVKFTVDEKG